jgi:hypothetical protein
MKDIFIHLGIQKTGTTFLQELCFPYLKGLCYIHKKNYTTPPPDGILGRLSRIANTNPLFLDLKKEKAELDRLIQDISEKTVLISYERLFGNMSFNFYDNFYNSRNLKYLFPAAKAIIVIRKQDDLLESLYKQCLRVYFCPTVDSFINYTDKRFEDPSYFFSYPSINAKQLDFYRYIQNYAEVFGRENVIVLPYEMLKVDQKEFLRRLFDFMPVEPFYPKENRYIHRSYSLLSSYIAFLLNRFVRVKGRESRLMRFIPNEPFSAYLSSHNSDSLFRRMLNKVNRQLSLNYVLEHIVDRFFYVKGNLISDRKRRMIMDIHRESNKLLDEEFNLNLSQYGYY